MTKSLFLALFLVAVAVGTGLALAQQKGLERGRPAGVEKKQPTDAEQGTAGGHDASIYNGRMTALVTRVDPKANTFVVRIEGKAVTFSAAKLKTVPRVGENLEVRFSWKPGESPMATSTAQSRSSTGAGPQERQKGTHCGGRQWRDSPFYSLHLGGSIPECNYNDR